MKFFKTVILSLVLLLTISSCTENSRAKNFGGKFTVNLPPNRTLMEATWKDNELWYLHRERREGEKPDTYIFQEESSLGVLQGRVIFKEK